MGGRGERGGRGAHFRRGGSAGEHDSSFTGERRGRGRGAYHRSRGKRDHYRGRGRAHPCDGASNFFRRVSEPEEHDDQDDKENDEEQMPDFFPRRKLESNWDRYEEPEKEEANDVPVQRGTDYHVLLSSAGDSFTQFRFLEEKNWEMDSLTIEQVPALVVDLEALVQSLQKLPLHMRLDLEPSVVQVSTPLELPSVGTLHKLDPNAHSGLKSPAQTHTGRESGLGSSQFEKPVSETGMFPNTSTAVLNPVDDADEELDLLLGLQKPITELSISETKSSSTVEEVLASSEKEVAAVEAMEEQAVEADQVKVEEEAQTNQQKAEKKEQTTGAAKQEMTEEDLEDWLDSMIN